MCLYLFKTSELVRYDQHDFEFELIFRCETCYCIFANKAAESYEFFADQTSPTSSAELMEPSKNLELRNVGETCSGISDISELFNRPRKLLLYHNILVIPIFPNVGDDLFPTFANDPAGQPRKLVL